jgi:hypothetical protein
MKKVAYAALILAMAIFLATPLSSEARGGHGGGHHGWWAPWAIIGGAVVLAPYFFAPPPVIIQERAPEYFQPAQSVTPSPAVNERLFIYPRHGQNEALQAKDRYECHHWAVSQVWQEPRKVSMEEWTLMIQSMPESQRADYLRAQGACLDARGYSVK